LLKTDKNFIVLKDKIYAGWGGEHLYLQSYQYGRIA
jgi:hypothetical protein